MDRIFFTVGKINPLWRIYPRHLFGRSKRDITVYLVIVEYYSCH